MNMRTIVLDIHYQVSDEGYDTSTVAILQGNDQTPLKELELVFRSEVDCTDVVESNHYSSYEYKEAEYVERFAEWLINSRGFQKVEYDSELWFVSIESKKKKADEDKAIESLNSYVHIDQSLRPLIDPKSRLQKWLDAGNTFSSLEPPDVHE